MIRKIIFTLLTTALLFSSHKSYADLEAKLIATVDRNKVAVNENIDLTISLQNAKAAGNIDLIELQEYFAVLSSSDSSSVNIINGITTINQSWILSISPKSKGKLTIKPIEILTDKGLLKSKPIIIDVGDAIKTESGTIMSATIGKKNPYLNESVPYKIILKSKNNLVNISLETPKSDDFIIEELGDPKQIQKVENGIAYNIIEINHIIRPLKTGRITIDAATFSGEIQVKSTRPIRSFFGSSFSHSYKRFSVSSKKIILDVKDAKTSLKDWLPLTSLKITEKYDNLKEAKIGEPINRTITISGIGMKSGLLPKSDYLESNENYKIYADQPEITDKKYKELPSFTKKITYAIIPQKDGKITITQIKIPWFDIKNHKLKYAILPSKTISVKKSNVNSATNNLQDSFISEDINKIDSSKDASKHPIIMERKSSKFWIIASLVEMFLIIILIAKIYLLRRNKVKHIDTKKQKNDEAQTYNKILNNIKNCATNEDLFMDLRKFCHKKFNLEKNPSLEDIKIEFLKYSDEDPKQIIELCDNLSKSLYDKHGMEVKIDREFLINILSNIEKKRDSRNSKDFILNP